MITLGVITLSNKVVAFQSVVVLAGGVGEFDENLKSVEFLSEGESEWTFGQDLPTPIRDSTMVTDQDGGAVIIGGISPDSYYVGQVTTT